MALIALAAHDPGGAAVLAAVAPALRARGHGLLWLPAGPAARLWREAGEYVPDAVDGAAAAAAIAQSLPELLLTGTSLHNDFERALWSAARRIGVPSFAVLDGWTNTFTDLDGWTNFEVRFVPLDGSAEYPDAFGVMDEATRARFAGRCRSRLFVVGQPHLAARTERLKRRRRGRPRGSAKRIVFFSEPIAEDYGRAARGFTQFEVATLAAEALAGFPGIVMDVKPHPREADADWRDWLARAPNARLAAEDTETLLAAADGVLGMTSTVLLEACLADIPALSLQPDRLSPVNSAVDSTVPIVVRRSAIAAALAEWLAALASPTAPPPWAQALLSGGSEHLAAAVEEMIAGFGSGKELP